MNTLVHEPGPLVSLCMATCLRSDLFPRSFQQLLIQTYSPLEIIILVDGADQGSIRIIEEANDPRVRWISTAHPSGMVPAWNRVCAEARGKYFLFCADDDLLLPQAIDSQVAILESYPNVAFCHADFCFIDDDGREISRSISWRGFFIDPGSKAWPRYVVATRCCMQTTVVRKSLWDQVGGWDVDAGNPGDNSLYLKLLRIGDVAHVPRLTCLYRVRTRNPDTWEKRFRNLREYHALAFKHLADPPSNLPGSKERVRSLLMTRLARDGLELARSANAEELKALTEWLEVNVWSGSWLGQLSRKMNRYNSLQLIAIINSTALELRALAKSFLINEPPTARTGTAQ